MALSRFIFQLAEIEKVALALLGVRQQILVMTLTTCCQFFNNTLSPKRRDFSEFYEENSPTRVKKLLFSSRIMYS